MKETGNLEGQCLDTMLKALYLLGFTHYKDELF